MSLIFTCPQCGYRPREGHSTQTTILSGPPTQEAIISTCQNIDWINDVTHHLHEHRAAHSRTLNELQSTTGKLPPEILSQIFLLICPPSEYNTSHPHVRIGGFNVSTVFILCAVCSVWRGVAISTPRLWAKFNWNDRHRFHTEATVGLLRTYLTRTGNVPLDLKLCIDPPSKYHAFPRQDQWSEKLIHHFEEVERVIVVENGDKVGRLDVTAPVDCFPRLGTTMTKLVEFKFKFRPWGWVDYPAHVDLSGVSSLRHFTCSSLRIRPMDLPWVQITTICLWDVVIDVCFDLLTQCPNLVEFHSVESWGREQESFEMKTEPVEVILHHLEWLEWSSPRSPSWDFAHFEKMDWPSLRRLSLFLANTHEVEVALGNLARQMPESCDHLELGEIYDLESLVHCRTLFNNMPQVKRLTVSGTYTPLAELVAQLLIPISTRLFILLPNLQTLCLRTDLNEDLIWGGIHDGVDPIAIGKNLVRMVQTRRDTFHITSFLIEADEELLVRLPDTAIAKFQGLVQEGFDVVVTKDSKRVDWLPG